MRFARQPQTTCGVPRVLGWHLTVTGAKRLVASCVAALCALLLVSDPSHAQDPSIAAPAAKTSLFPKAGSGIFGAANANKLDKSQPLYLQGDQLVYNSTGSKITARGNVEIFYNDYILTADEVTYDQSANTVTAVGNVVLKEPNGNIVRADRYTLTDDFRDGFVQSLKITTADDTKISAERATRREGNVTEFTNGKFTPCKTNDGTPPLWCISAAKIIHDQQAATITYQDAQFEILGVPILYLPYFEHADPTVKRKSGLLTPEFGGSDNLGFIYEQAYYWALDPSYDLTFHPRYMTEQGIMWQADWRQRIWNGQYSVKIAALDQDVDDLPSSLQDPDLDGWRGSVETKGLFSISSWWKFGWDATFESDDEFRRFYNLDSILLTDRVNQMFVTGLSDRNYFSAKIYQFGGLLLSDTPTSESWTHPIIDYNYVFADPVLGGELKWDTNVLSFSRDDAVTNDRTDINRAVTEVKWRRRLIDSAGITYTPFGELRGDVYTFNNYIDPTTGLAVSDESIARGLATGGVTVAYPWVANASNGSHVVEPIGQIIARQDSVTQDRLPDEDARSLVFDDTNLFETRKFSGYDRLETGTRANVGVQYTFQANTGGYARMLAGQSFHLAGDNAYQNPGVDSDGLPVFTPDSGLETARSDYILAMYLAPSETFRFLSQTRLDEETGALKREELSVAAAYGPLFGQGVYSYVADDPRFAGLPSQQEFQGTVGMRLTDYWSVYLSGLFDADENEFLQQALQIKYADECFVLTATYTQNNFETAEIDEGSTFMVRFGLKHLGEFGYKTDNLDHVFGDQPVLR